jgi:hypothetical protein
MGLEKLVLGDRFLNKFFGKMAHRGFAPWSRLNNMMGGLSQNGMGRSKFLFTKLFVNNWYSKTLLSHCAPMFEKYESLTMVSLS